MYSENSYVGESGTKEKFKTKQLNKILELRKSNIYIYLMKAIIYIYIYLMKAIKRKSLFTTMDRYSLRIKTREKLI